MKTRAVFFVCLCLTVWTLGCRRKEKPVVQEPPAQGSGFFTDARTSGEASVPESDPEAPTPGEPSRATSAEPVRPEGVGTAKVLPERARMLPKSPTDKGRPVDYLPNDASQNLAATLEARGLSRMAKLFREAGFADKFQGNERMTLLAPTDAAFSAVDAKTMAAIEGDPERRKKFVESHLLYGQSTVDALSGATRVRSVAGKDLDLSGGPKALTVGGATVTASDVLATNGLIHEIDRVLLPE